MSRAPIPFALRMQEPEIEWDDYVRIDPGLYLGCCTWAGKYYDRPYQHWTCLLRWNVISEDLQQTIAKRVPQWFRLGDGEKPRVSRRAKYFAAWIEANGGRLPSKSERLDRLSPQIFTRRLAKVEIGDAKSPAPYSVVKRIVSWETGATDESAEAEKHKTDAKRRVR